MSETVKCGRVIESLRRSARSQERGVTRRTRTESPRWTRRRTGDEANSGLPKAFIVRMPGSALTAEEVAACVADEVAPYKKVRLIEFSDAVPKAPFGKIRRRRRRDCEAARS
jgi:hypothetical protein